MKYVCQWGAMASPMMNYLLLFKPRKQSLRWSRALALAEAALALCDDHATLSYALIETVEAMRERRQRSDWKPFTQHNYLKTVIESTIARGALSTPPPGIAINSAPNGQSKTAQSIAILKALATPEGVPEWFTRVVCDAHIDMLLLGLDGTPASDVMALAATRFVKELWPRREWQLNSRELGARKLRKSIVAEAEGHRRWPTPKSVMAHIPA